MSSNWRNKISNLNKIAYSVIDKQLKIDAYVLDNFSCEFSVKVVDTKKFKSEDSKIDDIIREKSIKLTIYDFDFNDIDNT